MGRTSDVGTNVGTMSVRCHLEYVLVLLEVNLRPGPHVHVPVVAVGRDAVDPDRVVLTEECVARFLLDRFDVTREAARVHQGRVTCE